MTGSLETKYRWTEYGLTFTEKWNTDNTLGTEITVEDQVPPPSIPLHPEMTSAHRPPELTLLVNVLCSFSSRVA